MTQRQQPTHSSCVAVVDGPGNLDGVRKQIGAQLLCDAASRRELDNFLVATLDRAVALEEVHNVALRVTEELGLNVARLVQESASIRAFSERNARCFAT